MTKRRPTEIGDVLILRTTQSYTVYAVGSVSEKGQHNFGHQQAVHHVNNRDEAVKTAKAIVAPKGRIYLLDIDTADWSEISI
jgi:hypothetical protein